MSRETEKKRHELDLLCRAGAGLAPIAPAVCRLAREMVGAEAGALFWLDSQGQPEGFFHEHSTPDVQDLFLNEFPRLFAGPGEINVVALARNQGGQRIGHLLEMPRSYYRSNTFNLLVRASGHHHSLDLRIDVEGQARAVLLLFRTRAQAFDSDDAVALGRIEPYLHRALTSVSETSAWSVPASRTGHVLLGSGGQQLLMLSGEAEALLKSCTLVGQDVSLTGPLRMAPRFPRDLCARLEAAGQAVERRVLDIPVGRLAIACHRLHAPGMHAGTPGQILVTLELVHPPRLQVVQRLLELKLSPLQREIALLAGVGGLRLECERVIGVSNEALKKHLKTIYRVAGVSGWDGLATSLQSGVAVP